MKKITTYIGEQLTGPESDARYGVDATNPYTIEARDGEALDAACRRGAARCADHKNLSQANCRFSRSSGPYHSDVDTNSMSLVYHTGQKDRSRTGIEPAKSTSRNGRKRGPHTSTHALGSDNVRVFLEHIRAISPYLAIRRIFLGRMATRQPKSCVLELLFWAFLVLV